MKIALGVTTAGMVKSQTAQCLLSLIRETDCIPLFKEGPNQPLNREVLAETAIKLGCSHLFFVDSDMAFEAGALATLLQRDKDIIGVHYHQRKHPLVGTVKKINNIVGNDGVAEVEAIATGFMLIKTEVFQKIPKPWFHVGLLPDGNLEGHDYRFCRLAKETGYKVWCDFSIQIKHIGDFQY